MKKTDAFTNMEPWVLVWLHYLVDENDDIGFNAY